ncbi:restriction endonuclease subunit S [Synechococcus elongatus IITB4]|uniref:restriction endonuclease subunit S n=1 Tax=Synechococcus elongatus TaxID=32046 RepID=UPI0030D4E68F
MSFPKYPAYKNSGTSQIPEIPDHWQRVRLSRILNGIKDGTHGTFQRVDSGELLLSAKNVHEQGLVISESESLISQEDYLEIVASGYPAQGDVLLTIVGTIGRSCVFTEGKPLAFQRSVCFLRPQKHCLSRFLSRFLSSDCYQNQLTLKSKSTAQGGVYMGDIADTQVTLPPEHEQELIADFLDRETEKIDALIAEQQRLIELLQEKRQAVISHAVTKGLNPDAPMKDSGVEWLGQVPVHWELTRFKFVLSGLTDSEHKTCPEYPDGNFLIIRTTNVRDGELAMEGAKYTNYESYEEWTKRGRPTAGDLVFTREAPAGEACLIPEGVTACLGQRTVLMHPDHSKVEASYLLFCIYSGISKRFIDRLSQGSTVSHLNMSEIGNIPLLLPPRDEQCELVYKVREIQDRYKELESQASKTISLLQERRAALISAAVTGQIDVRGLAEAVA